MKRGVLIAFILFTGISLFAQKPFSVNFSVRAGANASNSSWDVESDLVKKKARIGFQVGVMAEYTFPTPFYLQTGLFLSTKGAKLKIDDSLVGSALGDKIIANRTLNQMYLTMPIHVAYKMYITNSTCVFFNLGPYLAYGIGGKNKVVVSKNEEADIVNEENTFGDSNDNGDIYGDLKKFDFGIGGGVGVEVGRVIVGLGCELGLQNISNSDAYKYKNVSSSITLGYRF